MWKNLYIYFNIKNEYNVLQGQSLGQSRPSKLCHFFIPKNRKKGLRKMSKLFMYGTYLEGIEQLAKCIQSLLPTIEFLDIPGMRPVIFIL